MVEKESSHSLDTVDTVEGRPHDLHRGHNCPRRNWPQLLNTKKWITRHKYNAFTQPGLVRKCRGSKR